MITLHPEILSKNGRKEFVVLAYEEFEALRAELEDLEDLRELRAAKVAEASSPATDWAEAKRQLGLK